MRLNESIQMLKEDTALQTQAASTWEQQLLDLSVPYSLDLLTGHTITQFSGCRYWSGPKDTDLEAVVSKVTQPVMVA